ncbi:MAG: protein kinase [Deltaproteobacteria bacterium]|nr:protein kinase [Deltaproteobacteria bacterium]
MKRFHDYLLVKPVAKGSLAASYKAKPIGVRGFTSTVLLQVLKQPYSSDGTFLEALEEELQLWHALEHPKILGLLDYDIKCDTPYIVMEYLHGRDLAQVILKSLRRKKKLPLTIGCRVGIELFEALWAAHKFNSLGDSPMLVVHGGITPRNVIFGFDGRIKLGDFAITRALRRIGKEPESTERLRLAYSSDLCAGNEPTIACDLFSVGVIMAELMVLKPLYPRNCSTEELRDRVMKSGWDHDLLNGLPNRLAEIIRKLLSKDKEQQYSSAMAARSAILEVTGLRPGQAALKPLSAAITKLFHNEITKEQEEERKLDNEISRVLKTEPIGSSDEAQFEVEVLPLSAALDYEGTMDTTKTGPKDLGAPLADLGDFDIEETTEASWDEISLTEMITGSNGKTASVDVSLLRKDILAGKQMPEPPSPPPLPGDVQTEVPVPGPKKAVFYGNLAKTSLPHILNRLAEDKRTGRLEVKRGHVVKSLYFKEGNIEYVRSNIESELLGEFLVKKGIIRRKTLEQALGEAAIRHMRLSELLLASGVLTAHQLASLLEEQIMGRLLKLFGWAAGKFAFYNMVKIRISKVPLVIDTHKVIFEGVMNHSPLAFIRASMSDDMDSVPKIKKALSPAFNLGPVHTRILRELSKGTSLRQIMQSMKQDSTIALRLTFMLREIGCLRFRSTSNI